MLRENHKVQRCQNSLLLSRLTVCDMVACSATALPSVQTLGQTPKHAPNPFLHDAVTQTQTLDRSLDLLHDSLGYAIKCAQVRTYEVLFGLLGETPTEPAMTPARMTALCLIARQPGISQSDLAERLSITRAAVVKVVDMLQARALVQRQPIVGNRRTWALQVTEAGYEELRRLTRLSQQYDARISARLSVDERQQLMALLARVAV